MRRAAATMADEKLRVLIVEDSLLTVRVLRDMIDAQPDMTVVDVAATGQDAVRLAAEVCPDVILMDIHLPDIDGVSATWVIASRNPDSSVIMVTSEGRTEYLQRAMVAGAQGYLLKPILDPAEMANTIRTVRQHALERWALLTPPGSVAVEAMRAELAARAGGAELLHRVAADTAGRRDVREIAESAATALCTLYQADAVGFYLRTDDGSLRTIASIGLSPEYVAHLHEAYAAPDAPRYESTSVRIRDLASASDSARTRDALLAEGFLSQVLIPTITQGRVVGRLGPYHRQPRSYRPHEIELLEIFAEQMAGAIGLAQAYTAVETLDRQREEFLALVSHELRQPVAAIATTAELLGDTPGLGPAEQRALGILRRQARRLAQLAEDVLAVARLETGRLQLERSQADLSA